MLRLIVTNLNYSSWSVRAWLALEQAGAPFKTLDVRMFVDETWREKVLQFSGAGKVPVLVDGNLTIHESLAICEYIAELFPGAQLWPEDRALRARARAISCEMHAGFGALRSAMPMNLRARAKKTPMNSEIQTDISRIEEIVDASLATSNGDFLFGDFTIADCMYFPVVSRFRTYGVGVGPATARYSAALFAHPLVRKLEALAVQTEPMPRYDALLA
jgi:glutathione S-transferase